MPEPSVRTVPAVLVARPLLNEYGKLLARSNDPVPLTVWLPSKSTSVLLELPAPTVTTPFNVNPFFTWTVLKLPTVGLSLMVVLSSVPDWAANVVPDAIVAFFSVAPERVSVAPEETLRLPLTVSVPFERVRFELD